ncbi:MAG: galactose ABC transporter substrate-binding protein [Treponema sp.]|jgi:methyl-galactoside transport system substrate-binding protein|nr:galactose ABC transporter substrate-binding protein [Treponema sp.]
MKKVLVVGIAVLLAFSLVQCRGGSTKAENELNIGVLVWKYDDAYGSTVRQAMINYAREIGAERGLKINLDLQDANDSMATQTDQATIMFASKPDFVIINVAEVASGKTLVDLAQENGVPFLFYNKEPTEDTRQDTILGPGSIFVGTSPREAGDMQGEILADLYKANPSIDKNGDGTLNYVMFMGEPNNPEAIARSQYSVETAQANGLTLRQLGQTLVCNWDQAAAQDAMTATIAQYGAENIEVVFANNDQMALGALAALNSVGYNTGDAGAPNAVVIGVDAVDGALESIKSGGMTATVKQDGDAMGRANILLAINKIQGRGWLDGTTYSMASDGYSIRIPYAKITQ